MVAAARLSACPRRIGWGNRSFPLRPRTVGRIVSQRQVERVIVLGFVEGIALRSGVVGLRFRLVVETLCDRIVRHDGVEVVLLALDLRRDERYQLLLDRCRDSR